MPEGPDPLALLLAASVAERQAAIDALLDSLAAEPDGLRLLKRLRSALERRLRALSRLAPGRGPGPARAGLGRRPPRPGPPG